jgi:hypothetical protein
MGSSSRGGVVATDNAIGVARTVAHIDTRGIRHAANRTFARGTAPDATPRVVNDEDPTLRTTSAPQQTS